MFRFALKSINSKKTISILYVIALSISMTISMLSINISSQIQEGFFRVDQKYDVVVGNKGSSTQLLMSSIFFSEDPLGTLPYSVVDDIKDIDETMKVVPIALGDNYRGSKIVGTEPNLLEGYEFSKGQVFGEDFEVVVGSNVAKAYNLEIGSQIVSSHGAGDAISGHDHSDSPYKVVGILKTTNTSYDNAVFTDICNIWSAHSNHDEEAHNEEEHRDEEHHDHEEEHSHDDHDHEDGHEHSDEEEHTHPHNHSDGEVTAILVRS
ncbi:MAG: ABC transporter permease, partial [Romboutsia timonensis]